MPSSLLRCYCAARDMHTKDAMMRRANARRAIDIDDIKRERGARRAVARRPQRCRQPLAPRQRGTRETGAAPRDAVASERAPRCAITRHGAVVISRLLTLLLLTELF